MEETNSAIVRNANNRSKKNYRAYNMYLKENLPKK